MRFEVVVAQGRSADGEPDVRVSGLALGEEPRFDPLDDRLRLFLIRVEEQDSELVTAEAGDEIVRANGGPEYDRDAAEQLVADAVAVRVVDLLEPFAVE